MLFYRSRYSYYYRQTFNFFKPYVHSDKNVSPFQVAMRDKQEYLVHSLVAHRLVSDIAGNNNKTSYEFKVRWLSLTALDE